MQVPRDGEPKLDFATVPPQSLDGLAAQVVGGTDRRQDDRKANRPAFSRVNGPREWRLTTRQKARNRLLLEQGGGKLCPVFYSIEPMRTKTEQKLTVHLDSSDVRVSQLASLLTITDSNGDTLHVFLSAQGWEQLRQTIHQRTLQAADS